MADVTIKTEPRAKTLGGVEKPKFVPKVQPKRNPIESGDAQSASASGVKKEGDIKGESRGSNNFKERREQREKFNRQKEDAGRAGGRGRGGRWTLPTGASFFTGNSSMRQTQARPGFDGGGQSYGGGGGGAAGGGGVPTVTIKHEADGTTSVVPIQLTTRPDAWQESDSDDDQDDAGRDEVWPPKEFKSMDPLALPFGPRTLLARKQVESMPILADPNDPRALAQEENVSTFVIQVPSDFQICKRGASKDSESDVKRNATASSLYPGKIGKIRMMKSGKIYLTLHNGRKYEVSSGMDVSFAQYVAAIDLHHVEPPPPAPLKGSSSSSAPAPAPAPAAAVDLPITGSFHLLSDVTRKLVITPAFLIGQRRSTATSAAASFGAATTPVEDLYELEPNY